jgi:hypothetical protein
MNFGSVEFTGMQTEKLPQSRGNDPAKFRRRTGRYLVTPFLQRLHFAKRSSR